MPAVRSLGGPVLVETVRRRNVRRSGLRVITGEAHFYIRSEPNKKIILTIIKNANKKATRFRNYTRLVFGDVTVRVHQMRLHLAQCVVLQIVEEQRAQSDQQHLDAADAQQHLQQDQLDVGQLGQHHQRQDYLPLLSLVLAMFLLARFFVE